MIKTKITKYEIGDQEFLNMLGIKGKLKFVSNTGEFVIIETVDETQEW